MPSEKQSSYRLCRNRSSWLSWRGSVLRYNNPRLPCRHSMRRCAALPLTSSPQPGGAASSSRWTRGERPLGGPSATRNVPRPLTKRRSRTFFLESRDTVKRWKLNWFCTLCCALTDIRQRLAHSCADLIGGISPQQFSIDGSVVYTTAQENA